MLNDYKRALSNNCKILILFFLLCIKNKAARVNEILKKSKKKNFHGITFKIF
jgi:hypothetical protein